MNTRPTPSKIRVGPLFAVRLVRIVDLDVAGSSPARLTIPTLKISPADLRFKRSADWRMIPNELKV